MEILIEIGKMCIRLESSFFPLRHFTLVTLIQLNCLILINWVAMFVVFVEFCKFLYLWNFLSLLL